MKIIGYADRFSAFPGDDVDILVSCETPNYRRAPGARRSPA